MPIQRRSRPRQSGKEQSLEGGRIENRQRLEGALDLLEVHSRFLDQTQKMNGSAFSHPPNYREQRTGVYDGLHMRREGGRARRGRKQLVRLCCLILLSNIEWLLKSVNKA